MTCIIGLIDNGKIYMGADSAGVAGLNMCVQADKKVFRINDFLIGFTTSFRMGQLLHYDFEPPRRYPNTDLYKYMVTDFVNEIRSCLKRGGFASKENEVERGGMFLVGHAGRLFKIEGGYNVLENILPFMLADAENHLPLVRCIHQEIILGL